MKLKLFRFGTLYQNTLIFDNMNPANIIVYTLLFCGAALCVYLHKLTLFGGVTGALVAVLVYNGAGYTGILMLALFFVLGTITTGWQRAKKQAIGIAEENKGSRTAGQVIANGGVAAILGALIIFLKLWPANLQLMMAGSLAAATADTLSSELGSVYGSKFFDILTFKRIQPGPDGIISLEGTLIGIVGALIVALAFAIGFHRYGMIWVIVVSGAFGNLIDSILGATLERKELLNNNAVNFLNTLTGAVTSVLLLWIIK